MTTTMKTEILKGHDAIEHAEANGLTLNKYADPTEDARDGLSTSEARAVAKEDPSLIWIEPSAVSDSVTDEQIQALRDAAGTAGDHAQAMICDIALGQVSADDSYDHLRIWSFLSESDKRRIRQLDEQGARDVCAEVIMSVRGEATSARRMELLSALRAHDRGDGCLALIVDQALADDPAVTVEAVREIVLEAESDAAR